MPSLQRSRPITRASRSSNSRVFLALRESRDPLELLEPLAPRGQLVLVVGIQVPLARRGQPEQMVFLVLMATEGQLAPPAQEPLVRQELLELPERRASQDRRGPPELPVRGQPEPLGRPELQVPLGRRGQPGQPELPARLVLRELRVELALPVRLAQRGLLVSTGRRARRALRALLALLV